VALTETAWAGSCTTTLTNHPFATSWMCSNTLSLSIRPKQTPERSCNTQDMLPGGLLPTPTSLRRRSRPIWWCGTLEPSDHQHVPVGVWLMGGSPARASHQSCRCARPHHLRPAGREKRSPGRAEISICVIRLRTFVYSHTRPRLYHARSMNLQLETLRDIFRASTNQIG